MLFHKYFLDSFFVALEHLNEVYALGCMEGSLAVDNRTAVELTPLNIIDGNYGGSCARALGNHADATFSTFNGDFIIGIDNLDACAVLDF